MGEKWSIILGSWIGAAATTWLLLPDALMPGWIANWQRGSWGEENTASELKRLRKSGWTIRHDLASLHGRGNIDHLVVGSAAYVLDSKNLNDSTIEPDGNVLRVSRIDDPDDGYVWNRFAVARQARELERDIQEKLGFRIQVQPIVVIWGALEPREVWIGDVAVVEGTRLVEWIEQRPVNLLRADKRRLVAAWAEQLPHA